MSFADEEIARIAHGAAVELTVVLGAPALPAWSSLDPNTRGNEVYLVRAARHGATPEAVHERRMQLDPDLVPFDQLPPGDRARDYLFAGICTAMNAAADVRTRAENEQLAIKEALQQAASLNQPFGGAAPIAVELEARPPQRQEE